MYLIKLLYLKKTYIISRAYKDICYITYFNFNKKDHYRNI